MHFHYKINKEFGFWNCINSKMLEHDWLLAALIYGLIGFFRSKLNSIFITIVGIELFIAILFLLKVLSCSNKTVRFDPSDDIHL